MFWTDDGGPYARALERWREAANLVSNRWAACLEADGATRPWAFASYLAALDAEAAAASELQALSVRLAA